jgi:DNA-binding NarL/FixJ family response regulator
VSSLLAPASPGRELPPVGPLLEPLSKIELEILSLLNQGLTNQEIANKLAMTVGTIKWRMNQIFGNSRYETGSRCSHEPVSSSCFRVRMLRCRC